MGFRPSSSCRALAHAYLLARTPPAGIQDIKAFGYYRDKAGSIRDDEKIQGNATALTQAARGLRTVLSSVCQMTIFANNDVGAGNVHRRLA